jgi:glycosyltransferase involved in cell wall biosynthesis
LPATPQVSLGMPVYNGKAFIREALNSLLAQTFTDVELIISDNASTDETEIICREYADKDARIRYVRQAENRGAAANFQFVLNEAGGEYFMWVAADDLQSPNFLESLVSALEEDADLVCVMSDVKNIDEHDKTLSISRLEDIRLTYVKRDWQKIRRRFFRNPTSNIFFCIYGLFKKQQLVKVSLNYHGKIKYAFSSEVPFLAQLALIGPIGSIAEPLKIYRRHDGSVYHKEQSAIQTSDRLKGFINVSILLLKIINKSHLSFNDKLTLYFTVVFGSIRWVISFVLRLVARFIPKYS